MITHNFININSLSNLITEQFPGAIWCKDTSSNFTYANPHVVELLGFRQPEDVIGISDYDYNNARLSELAHEFREEDARVVGEATPMKIIFHGNHFSKEPHTWLCEKSPLRDPQGKLIGTLGVALNITQNRRIRNSILLANERFMAADATTAQFSVSIEDYYPELRATPRETCCLFYLMRGKTAKEIARILGISPKTVENHIERLRLKANCCNKSELIDKCITRGLINVFPSQLLESVSEYFT